MTSNPSSPYVESDDSRFYDDVRYTDRPVPRISLRHFHSRVDAITAEVTAAAERHGFFALADHGISSAAIDAQFLAAEQFFALPEEVKAKMSFDAESNAGWEQTLKDVAPGAADAGDNREQESYQVRLSEAPMAGRWVSDADLPGFRQQSVSFMQACHSLSMRLMVCLARGLGFSEGNGRDDHVFVKAHDPAQPGIQTVLRLQRYFATAEASVSSGPSSPSARSTRSATPATTPPALADTPSTGYMSSAPGSAYRGGTVRTFSDSSCLTLRFLRPGQSGLEICQGRGAVTDSVMDAGSEWTKIDPASGEIICSVGDLLMLWSDDRYKSALYRERAPTDPAVDHFGDCYSIAYMNQPSHDCLVQGPQRTYPAMTAGAFLDRAQTHHLAELAEKKRQKVFADTIAATSAAAAASFSHGDTSTSASSSFGMSSYIETTF